jgi:acetoacetate decarboxylase
MGFPPAPWRLHGELIFIPAHWGGAMLANYTGGTLAYHELIVFRPGWVVSYISVDSEESLRGGREIWQLPKELAEFTYSRSYVEVRQDGRTVFTARIRRRPGFVPVAFPAPAKGGKLSVGWITTRAAPALVEAHGFGLDGTRLALAGDGMRLYMP